MYSTLLWGNTATGFQYYSTMYLPVSDLEGYIGYLPSDNSIYVVFRGSSSLNNWIANMTVIMTPYTSYPSCTNCQVHEGWYTMEQNILPQVLQDVAALKAMYPTAQVRTTGHSLGAALATLTAMDLALVYPVSCYNYGSPRVGNTAFSALTG